MRDCFRKSAMGDRSAAGLAPTSSLLLVAINWSSVRLSADMLTLISLTLPKPAEAFSCTFWPSRVTAPLCSIKVDSPWAMESTPVKPIDCMEEETLSTLASIFCKSICLKSWLTFRSPARDHFITGWLTSPAILPLALTGLNSPGWKSSITNCSKVMLWPNLLLESNWLTVKFVSSSFCKLSSKASLVVEGSWAVSASPFFCSASVKACRFDLPCGPWVIFKVASVSDTAPTSISPLMSGNNLMLAETAPISRADLSWVKPGGWLKAIPPVSIASHGKNDKLKSCSITSSAPVFSFTCLVRVVFSWSLLKKIIKATAATMNSATMAIISLRLHLNKVFITKSCRNQTVIIRLTVIYDSSMDLLAKTLNFFEIWVTKLTDKLSLLVHGNVTFLDKLLDLALRLQNPQN